MRESKSYSYFVSNSSLRFWPMAFFHPSCLSYYEPLVPLWWSWFSFGFYYLTCERIQPKARRSEGGELLLSPLTPNKTGFFSEPQFTLKLSLAVIFWTPVVLQARHIHYPTEFSGKFWVSHQYSIFQMNKLRLREVKCDSEKLVSKAFLGTSSSLIVEWAQ